MSRVARRPRLLRLAAWSIVIVALALSGPLAASAGTTSFSIKLTKVVGGLVAPTQVTNARDGTNRLFIVEKRGTVRVVQNGALKAGYFLDIRDKVSESGERGLLGLAFHPNFKTNHRVYAYYTNNGGDIVVSRFTTNSTRTDVVESTATPFVLIEHSAATNHNGGAMAFGPNGYLYIGVGDGGGSGDPGNDAQELTTTFLGKILRLDVNGSGAGKYGRYAIPSSNPFAGPTYGHGEIWAYGLRNPWRISFDRATGELFIADVGQNAYEEIDREPAGYGGGRNYGWSAMEGFHCYKPSLCPFAGDTLPVAEYSHAGGNCAITGGYVYRGKTYTKLVGLYVFADWCSGRIWTMPHDGSTKTQRADVTSNITSFGESEYGELYAVSSGGSLLRVSTT
jgi:glucose/arabinose dehydrogenase